MRNRMSAEKTPALDSLKEDGEEIDGESEASSTSLRWMSSALRSPGSQSSSAASSAFVLGDPQSPSRSKWRPPLVPVATPVEALTVASPCRSRRPAQTPSHSPVKTSQQTCSRQWSLGSNDRALFNESLHPELFEIATPAANHPVEPQPESELGPRLSFCISEPIKEQPWCSGNMVDGHFQKQCEEFISYIHEADKELIHRQASLATSEAALAEQKRTMQRQQAELSDQNAMLAGKLEALRHERQMWQQSLDSSTYRRPFAWAAGGGGIAFLLALTLWYLFSPVCAQCNLQVQHPLNSQLQAPNMFVELVQQSSDSLKRAPNATLAANATSEDSQSERATFEHGTNMTRRVAASVSAAAVWVLMRLASL